MRVPREIMVTLALALVVLSAAPAVAVTAGRAAGTVTIDGRPVTLVFAASGTTEGLFDDTKQDTIATLSDVDLGDTRAEDDMGLHLRAREGELTALALRLDGPKLVNVSVHAKVLDGVIKLPGAWFTWRPNGTGGVLSLAERESDGHRYACSVEFVPAPPKPVEAAPVEAAEPVPVPVPEAPAALPPASTSSIDPAAMAALLVEAMMQKDEDRAVKLINSGADANARDQYGTPMLNWAVMMCEPKVVQALIRRGADLKYERAPGLTILTEAGACPDAAVILKAAGAK